MRKFVIVLFALAALAEALPAQRPESESVREMRRVGTMSQIMVHLIYPTSDAVFYIDTRTPTTEAEWGALEAKTLMLAESANLLLCRTGSATRTSGSTTPNYCSPWAGPP